ncbi:MAG: hypothetical protein C0434_10270 [Xanthomonadaceae bacterium]|nr:hypothetical protein [Xanthomonadaceae bacterium]
MKRPDPASPPCGGSGRRSRRLRRALVRVAALLSLALASAILPGATVAQTSVVLARLSLESAADFVAQPLTSSSIVTPLVMLGLAIDEKAYRRAYDDLVDVDGDGLIDPDYRNAVAYGGYFDSDLCYGYDGGLFRAGSTAVDHHCVDRWSGNFLNWLTMTRLDLIRQALYGGHRVVDSDTRTVLERAAVPEDSHAWVKVYAGADLPQLMPAPASAVMSFCNVSRPAGDGGLQPLLRVAAGAFPLWASIDRFQCDGANGAPRPGTPGGPDAAISDYLARVEVCSAPAAVQESACQQYPSGAAKPVGALQRYGEAGTVRFGLLARSASRPRSGGQLRRNIGPIARNGNDPAVCASGDEIRLATGQFCPPSAATGGVISALERLRITGYAGSGDESAAIGYRDCRGDALFTRAAGGNGIRRPGPLDGQACSNDGNPVAEILAEALRYVAGASGPSPAFYGSADDERAYLADTELPDWRDPLRELGTCAECSVVMISNGAASFDGDELPDIALKVAGAIAATDITAATDRIGSAEGLDQRVALARLEARPPGATDSSADGARCGPSAEPLTRLSTLRGICPVEPARDGSFNVAGVAYLGHTRDLRPDLAGRQTAALYALELDDPVPSIPVRTAGGLLTITPTCQSLAGTATSASDPASPRRQCSFAAASVGPMPAADGTVYGRPLSASGRAGSLYVAWDDTPYGNVQETRAAQMITWCVGAECQPQGPAGSRASLCHGTSASSAPDCVDGALRSLGSDELVVRVETLSGGIGAPMLHGFVISGAADASRDGSYTVLQRPRIGNRDGSRNLILAPERPLPGSWNAAEVRSFSAGDSGVRKLPSPLELAAKYGSFTVDPNAAEPLPEAAVLADGGCRETSWDRLDNSRDGTPDCVPDHYHLLHHPGQLGSRLRRVIRDVIARSSVAQTRRVGVQSGFTQGAGAAYQSFYESRATDAMGRSVAWVGNVQALFVDRDGQLREDDPGRDGVLDESDYASHPVVQFFFDAAAQQTRFRRFRDNPATAPDAFEVIDDPRQLRTIWNAGQQLANLPHVEEQRSYRAPARRGRHLLSFVDLNLDGKAQPSETVDFLAASFGPDRNGVLNVDSPEAAAALVAWTRGTDVPGLRSRQIDRDGSGLQTQRLGDIVNSQPLLVAAPAEAYDLLYGDRSYAQFFRQYRDRRQVVYVGANDGMLHAFNAGFRRADGRGFATAPASGSATEHPLGSELWAYIPFNLLPHLGFVAAADYTHQWLLDGTPRAFDVRAFPADATHPGGWGTLLVVGMRLGGGPLTIPQVQAGGANRERFGAFAAGLRERSEFGVRSAYVVLDITDPEQPPRVIAEIADRERERGMLGYTTARPAVAAFATGIDPATRSDAWYLFAGNGPDLLELDNAVSRRPARLFAANLGSLLDPGMATDAAIETFKGDGVGTDEADFAPLAGSSFIGDPVAVDWDLDYRADALYFGISGGSAASPTGKLFRLAFNPPPAGADGRRSLPPVSAWSSPVVVLDTQAPVLNAPALTQDERGNRWLLAGTGRYLAAADRGSTARQALFGVIDRVSGTNPAARITSLTDTTAAAVSNGGVISGLGAGVSSEAALISAIRGDASGTGGSGGWFYQLAAGSAASGAERVISNSVLLDGTLFASAYTPVESLCTDQGSSRLFAVNFLTGAPRVARPVLRNTVVIGSPPVSFIPLGQGLTGVPSLLVNPPTANGRGGYTISLPSITGAIVQRRADDGGRLRSGEIDWRENHPN